MSSYNSVSMSHCSLGCWHGVVIVYAAMRGVFYGSTRVLVMPGPLVIHGTIIELPELRLNQFVFLAECRYEDCCLADCHGVIVQPWASKTE